MIFRTVTNSLVLSCLLCGVNASSVFGHFLFIRIGEHAEAGRAAEVFFSEKAEAGDPRFVQKVAGTQLWMQREPGKFVPLITRLSTDRLKAFLPTEDAVSVTGICTYGILQREVPFLLKYHPKAISGSMTEINRFKANEDATLEIVATVAGESVVFTLLDHGKPVPNAVFTTVDDDLVNEELKADGEGRVTWKPPKASHYCVYTKVVRNQAGEYEGKKYTEIREFPTIAFHWPFGRIDSDNEAITLFESALATRANWKNFPGFAAVIEGQYDGRNFSGKISIDKEGKAAIEIDQEVAQEWVTDQLRSIVLHRMESPRRSKPILRFADHDTSNPMGRLLKFVGGQFASSYRVKDDQLSVVNRNMGTENMTITVLENEKNADGRFLPHLYNVQYWNAENGNFLRNESFENRWQRFGDFDLPILNTMITSSASGLSVRSFRLSKHELKKAE